MLLVVFGAGASYDSSMDYSPSVEGTARDGLLIRLREFLSLITLITCAP